MIAENKNIAPPGAKFFCSGEFFYQLKNAANFSGAGSISGVLVRRSNTNKNSLQVISTDGFCLYMFESYIDAYGVDNDCEFVIPTEWIKDELPTIIKENGGKREFDRLVKVPFELKIEDDNNKICEFGNTVKYKFKCNKNKFPNIERIMFYENEFPCKYNPTALKDVVNNCLRVSNLNKNKVTMSVDKSGLLKVTFRYKTDMNVIFIQGKVPVSYDGEPFKLELNCSYLKKFLNVVDELPSIGMYYYGHDKPLMFKANLYDNEKCYVKFLQMPIVKFE